MQQSILVFRILYKTRYRKNPVEHLVDLRYLKDINMKNLSENISDNLINDITNALTCDMICFINPDTYEVEDVPHDILCGLYHDETWQEALNRVDQWGTYITIDRPGLSDSVKIMRSFVDGHIPSGQLQKQLSEVLALRRPDKYFHNLVEKSDYRDKWATYHHRQMMRHVRKQLRDQLVRKPALPSVAVL